MGITSAGLGSGLDVEGLIKNLMAAERQPITQLQSRQSSFEAKISAYGSLKGLLSTLETASDTLSDINKLAAFTASSSDTAVVTSTASSAASAGTYALNVTQLAKAQKSTVDSTTAFTAETDVVGAGTLTLNVNGTSKDITLTSGSATLADLRNAINGAKAGVTASIVVGGTPSSPVAKLVLKADNTNQIVSISTSAPGDFGGKFPGTLTNIDSAQPAIFTVDGLAVTSNSNVVTSALGGVTLTLKKEGSSTVTINRDSGAVRTAAEAFVKAYNDVVNNIRSATAYNQTTKTGSALTGDYAVRSISSQLSNKFISTPSGLSTGDLRLADVGISLNKDGTIKLDSTKLQSAIENNFSGLTKTLNAFGSEFETLAHSMVSVDGIIASRTNGLRSSVSTIDRSIESLEYRMTQIEKRYRTQFSSLDVMVSQAQQTSAYLSQQLSRL